MSMHTSSTAHAPCCAPSQPQRPATMTRRCKHHSKDKTKRDRQQRQDMKDERRRRRQDNDQDKTSPTAARQAVSTQTKPAPQAPPPTHEQAGNCYNERYAKKKQLLSQVATRPPIHETVWSLGTEATTACCTLAFPPSLPTV